MEENKKSFVLITGASAGIGRALAEEFAIRKKNLLLVSLPQTGLEEVARDLIARYKVEVNTFTCDLTLSDGPVAIFQWCEWMNYTVQVLVNNAGFGNLQSFASSKFNLLDNMMKLNNHAVIMMTHLFIDHLRKFTESHVLNVSSMAAFFPLPQKSVYAATKSFIYTFSDSLRHELKHENISVSCLCPGGTLTERIKSSLTTSMKEKMNFFQTPEEVAADGVSGMYEKKFRIIPGWRNRLMFYVSRMLPEFVKIKLVGTCFAAPKTNYRFNSQRPALPFGTFALLRL